MKIKTIKVGPLETNCYIVENENNSFIIDPGDEGDKIQKQITGNVIGILLTHDHFDHIGALKEIEKIYHCPVYQKQNLEEKEYKIGPFTFDVIYTPGHTEDSITFYFKDENILFTGDFIFKGTVGRWDLETGSKEKMYESLHKIKTYPNGKIYPGHGDATCLETEKKNNPYFHIVHE